MNFFKSKSFTFLLVLVIGWLSLSFIKIKLHDNIVNKEVNELEEKVSNLEKSNNIIKEFISFMNVPAYLERQARIKLNYKALGEEVVFVYPDNGIKASSSFERLNNHNLPNYIKWWLYMLEVKN